MTRASALQHATEVFDSGHFLAVLSESVTQRTESQESNRQPELLAYLSTFIAPLLARLGFETTIYPNPIEGAAPLLLATRIEQQDAPTVLLYGHGDVVRGYDEQWQEGLSPWSIVTDQDKWYGRGTADNKGQHLINILALQSTIKARNKQLGFNVKLLLEMGEEVGSPGLQAFCEQHREALAADLLIASDGPRLSASQPTLFLGSRGALNFDLKIHARDGAHHSGNWGGLLRNPGTVLANAIASLIDEQGRIKLAELKPSHIPEAVRLALQKIELTPNSPNDPPIDVDWGEPGLTPVERVFGWNTLEVLAFQTGNPKNPVNAIPGNASAHCQIRFVPHSAPEQFITAIEQHFQANGFGMIEVVQAGEHVNASRLDLGNEWVEWALASIYNTTGQEPALLPNLGGTIPNGVFSDTLSLPTLWIPHSYPACSQHAPNEHLLAPIARQGLQIMSGIFWDLGEIGPRKN